MLSGMYLGDIVRRVILRISLESDMFGLVSSKLSEPFVLRYVLYISIMDLCIQKKTHQLNNNNNCNRRMADIVVDICPCLLIPVLRI